MMYRPLAAALLATAAVLATPAAAAPLIYSESTDGAIGSGALLGALGIGNNTVTGTRADGIFERFQLTLPEGLRLTGVTVDVRDIALLDAGNSFGGARVEALSILAWSNSPEFNGNGTVSVFSGAWDGALQLTVFLNGSTIRVGNVGVSYDYAVSLTVIETPDPVPVPEPIGLALFGAGLAGLIVARRRKA
jgi:hypothetical protein